MKAAIRVILSGTRMGEITLVAISVAPLGRCATKGAASRSYRPDGPGQKASTAKAAAIAMVARMRRSRSSTKCETNGASVPSSSSFLSGSLIVVPSSPAA